MTGSHYLTWPLTEDEQEPALTSSLAESYVGCGKSDPNEPVSETPLYDDMWPEDIQEEDKGQFFSPSKQGTAAQVVEVAVLEFGATLSHFDTSQSLLVFNGNFL